MNHAKFLSSIAPVAMLLAAGSLTAQTVTTFNGGSLNNDGSWSTGRPFITENRVGTIAVDGIFNGDANGWSVTQTGGTLTLNASRNVSGNSVWTMTGGSIVPTTAGTEQFQLNNTATFNFQGGSITNVGRLRIQLGSTFNQSGGSINAIAGGQTGELTGGDLGSAYNMTGGTASFVTLNLNSTALNFSGGTFTVTNLAHNIRLMTIDGTASVFVNSSSAIGLSRFETSNWLSTGTGASLTVQGWSLSDFENVFTSGRIQFNGSVIDAATFAETFQVNGSTLTMVPEPSTYAALLGLLALGTVAWRRRGLKR